MRDLFGSMPVRIKQRSILSEKQQGNAKLFDSLKRDLVMLLLSWPPGAMAVTIRDLESNQKTVIRKQINVESNSSSVGHVDVQCVCSILVQAAYIALAERSSWVHVSGSTSTLEITGAMSLIPNATKNVQFIAFGIEPLLQDGQNILYDDINRLFSNSAFGTEEEAEELNDAERDRRRKDRRYKGDGPTQKELKGRKKGVERWPMFYINIHPKDHSRGRGTLDIDEVLDNKGNTLGVVTDLLHAIIFGFLTTNHFRPRPSRKRLQQQIPVSGLSNVDSNQSRAASPIQTNAATNIPTSDKFSRSLPPSPSLDMLSTNVKLPSFRRSSSKLESSFESWPIIKSSSKIPNPMSQIEESAGAESKSANGQRQSTPLLSQSGKVVRRPFDDVIEEVRPRKSRKEKPAPSITAEGTEDGIVEWINPITKVKSLVNQRTGLAVAKRKDDPSGQHSWSLRLPKRDKSSVSKRDEPSPWLRDVLSKWENPIFAPVEKSIPQISLHGIDFESQNILHGRHHNCTQIDIDRAFKESSSGLNGRISKDALRNAEVVSQVDKKFILVKIHTFSNTNEELSLLVIVDQHAADERIRIESLMAELCTAPRSPSPYAILTSSLEKPLTFDVSNKEIELFRSYSGHFSNWGIRYDLPPATNPLSLQIQRLTVHSLPPGISERCKLDPKLLIALLRTELWKQHSNPTHSHSHSTASTYAEADTPYPWLKKIHNCPQGILDLLNSRACRSAIMFNDELSNEQCKVLIKRLADCAFPFQCAHGRPSLVPLVDLMALDMGSVRGRGRGEGSEEAGFGKAFVRWRDSLREDEA